MNAKDLKGRAVVTLSDAAKLGQVDDVLFDALYRDVLGFRVKTGGVGPFAKTEAVLRENIASIGVDALTASGPDVMNDEDRFAVLNGAVTLEKVEGTKVVSEGGELLGTIDTIELDSDARLVVGYRLKGSLWERLSHHQPLVRADQVLRLGENNIMIVSNAVADSLKAE